jgi:hypothetical protein
MEAMMKAKAVLVAALCLSVPLSAFADFQYTETTKITGGSVVQMMKFAGALSKQARQGMEPVTSTVVLKGNRMAHINKDSTEIIDLDKETITHIDHVKKQYTVMTFQQMKEQMEKAQSEAAKQRHEKDEQAPEMTFKVNVKNTGATRQVTGLNASESILQLSAEAKDQKSGQTGVIAMTNDMWMVPEIPGYAEVRAFHQRMAVKMGMVFSGMSQNLFAMQKGSAQGMAELYKEMSKLKGVPVLQIMRMGTTTNGQPLPAASEAPLPEQNGPAMPSAGEVAEQGAQDAAASTLSSKLGKLGGLGGFGGFGHKKKQQTEEQKPAEQKPAAEATPTSLVFMETNTETNSFSSASVDSSKFAIPAGYQLVENKQ